MSWLRWGLLQNISRNPFHLEFPTPSRAARVIKITFPSISRNRDSFEARHAWESTFNRQLSEEIGNSKKFPPAKSFCIWLPEYQLSSNPLSEHWTIHFKRQRNFQDDERERKLVDVLFQLNNATAIKATKDNLVLRAGLDLHNRKTIRKSFVSTRQVRQRASRSKKSLPSFLGCSSEKDLTAERISPQRPRSKIERWDKTPNRTLITKTRMKLPPLIIWIA